MYKYLYYIYIYIYTYIYISISISDSLSLSLYIYIYIYIHTILDGRPRLAVNLGRGGRQLRQLPFRPPTGTGCEIIIVIYLLLCDIMHINIIIMLHAFRPPAGREAGRGIFSKATE